MSNRRQKRLKEVEKRRKVEELRRAMRRKRVKRFVAVVIVLVLVVLVGWRLTQTAPPYDYVQCFSAGSIQQYRSFWLYIQVGEQVGELNVSFIRIPEYTGVDQYCKWPMYTSAGAGERDSKYTKIHVEAPNTHTYVLGDFFASWSEWMKYPAYIYFSSDGVSYYRTDNFEMLVNGQRNLGFSVYVPRDVDRIDLIVHEPFQTVPGPYPGGQLPIDADFSVAKVSSLNYAFAGSVSGGVAPYTYEWDFGDGSPRVSGSTVMHKFPRADSFLVIMYVKDVTGAVASKPHAVGIS